VIGAGCFVFTGLLGLVGAAGATRAFDHRPRWLVCSAFATGLLALVGVAQWLLGRRAHAATRSRPSYFEHYLRPSSLRRRRSQAKTKMSSIAGLSGAC
jgi:hypothetical protein